MAVVMIYGFTGRYSGASEYQWNHPEPGAVHSCILFLRQESDSNDVQAATSECRRYGFTEIENMQYGKLDVDVLNADLYRGFARFYESALEEGSTLVYYPNKGTDAENAA